MLNTSEKKTNTFNEVNFAWQKSDTVWMLGLYGTAIGAGVLFLPINAGIGGLLPLIIMTVLAFPMTFYAHRALTRFVLSHKPAGADITDVVGACFGRYFGNILTVLYFFSIYPILLMYAVAITNTADSFITHQLGLQAPPRWLLSLGLISGFMLITRFGQHYIVKAMSFLVLPFAAALMLLAVYLIPKWNIGAFYSLSSSSLGNGSNLLTTLWLAIPVMVFAFNHSPIISSFAVAKAREYGANAEKQCSRILAAASLMMVVSVMFFVFSCVFCLTPSDLLAAKQQNISILSYLANHFHVPFIEWMGPIIAMVAITKSFLGHYLGASEGFIGIVSKSLAIRNKRSSSARLSIPTAIFMLLTCWAVATWNPSIMKMIEMLAGPVIALLLFLLPMYAIHHVPAMQKYRGKLSNIFVTAIGLIAISAISYSLISG